MTPPPSSRDTAGLHVPVGDVVVRTVSAGMGAGYALTGVPESGRLVFASMRAASQQARDYARRADVDAWVEHGAGHIVRIARFRRPGNRAAGGPVQDR